MKINETSITIDKEAHKRLTTDSAFQRTMNIVAMMDQLTCELQNEILMAMGLNEQQRQREIAKLSNVRADSLRTSLPSMPNFDSTVIDVFYGIDNPSEDSGS